MKEYEISYRKDEPSERPIYEAINSDGSVLKFTGELVAHVTSELPEKDNWTEFKLYLTDFNTWVLQGIGGTRVRGQKNRYWYVVSSDPTDWLDKVLQPEKVPSRLAKKLLRDAFTYLKDCEDVDE